MEHIMSVIFKPTALVGAVAIAMGLSSTVFAETSSNSEANSKLNTIVVTATRSEEKIENVPARISIIEPQILEQSPIAELPHLLMSDASIDMMQYGGYGQAASIFTRGTNSTHTLVLRDGVRLNTGSAGSASLAFIDTTDIYLFDSKGYEKSMSFNHSLIEKIKINKPLMIAGNIQINDNLENYKKIADIIDISGGLETYGLKDISKIDIFLKKIKNIKYET